MKITTDGEVEDTTGRVIPGLFAGGELVGGIFYQNYLGGAGLLGSVFGTARRRSAGTLREDASEPLPPRRERSRCASAAGGGEPPEARSAACYVPTRSPSPGFASLADLSREVAGEVY